ncbi:hypothetical protein [Celerinatantimonas sp. MCCC 1A17872]|uniref:hypothetical protein n=1 Tax=Celerinatantimonas sp. MCCC 1A17872 TaxID=3177514 RepID=UPI0038C6DAF0
MRLDKNKWSMLLLVITLVALGIDWLNCAYQVHQLHHQIFLKRKLVNAHVHRKSSANLQINRSWLSELPFALQSYQRHGQELILNGQGDFASFITWLNSPINLAINEQIQEITLSKSPKAEHLTIRLKLLNPKATSR